MRSWLLLLAGMMVWAIHFFALYAIAEIAPDRQAVVGITAACLFVDLCLMRAFVGMKARDHFAQWRRSVAIVGTGLSLIAVSWQALPALVP